MQIAVFWHETTCSLMGNYQQLPSSTLNMDVVGLSEALVRIQQASQRHIPENCLSSS